MSAKHTTRAGFATGLSVEPTLGPVQAPNNIKEHDVVDMGFKVSPEFQRDFKTTAAMNGLKMKELLEQSFAEWKKARK